MEKGHLSIKKVVKNLRNQSKIKTLGTCFNSFPAAAHMYKWILRNQKYPIIAIFTVCLNVLSVCLTFTGNWQNLKNLVVLFKSYAWYYEFGIKNELSHTENWTQTLDSFIFLVKAAVKFRNLQINKILNTDANRIFPIPFKVMYVSLRYK